MGFFDRFFKKKVEKKTIKISELDSYINNAREKKFSLTNSSIDLLYGRINSIINELNENLIKLEEAKLLNENIPVRVRHLMEGNRSSYISKIKLFLEDFKLPEKRAYKEILELCNGFDNRLNELNKATFKGYQVLAEFFNKEATDIATNIREIKENIQKLRYILEHANLDEVNILREIIKNLHISIDKKKKSESEKEDAQEKIVSIEEKIESIKKNIERLKKSKEYLALKELDREKARIEEQIKQKNEQIIHIFSILERALKKYKRGSLDEKLIDAYLENPVTGIMEDKELKILEVLQKLKGSIEREVVILKEKKKSKTIETIGSLNEALVNEIREKLEKLSNSERAIVEKLRNVTINNSIKAETEKIEHFENKLREEKKILEKIKKEIDEIDIKKEKAMVEKELFDYFEEEIKLL